MGQKHKKISDISDAMYPRDIRKKSTRVCRAPWPYAMAQFICSRIAENRDNPTPEMAHAYGLLLPFNIRDQEKMRGQRGRLPVQALGYVNFTKVILGLPETAGVHFLLRPHHYILKVITQFRNGGPRANTSMEASFTGIFERNGISGRINQRGTYIFTTC